MKKAYTFLIISFLPKSLFSQENSLKDKGFFIKERWHLAFETGVHFKDFGK